MEENKKRMLNEEELEQVAGGVQYVEDTDGKKGWRCSYCRELFPTKEEAEEHEEICHKNPRNKNYQRLLKPIIL